MVPRGLGLQSFFSTLAFALFLATSCRAFVRHHFSHQNTEKPLTMKQEDSTAASADQPPEETGDVSHPYSAKAAIEFARQIGRLKTTPRTGWVRRGVPRYESVADHSWRVAALSLLLLGDREDDVDVRRCMQLAVVHDLAECHIGDIAPDDNVSAENKLRMEQEAMQSLGALLQLAVVSRSGTTDAGSSPPRTDQFLLELFHEYEERKSNEAVAVKDLDLLDMILQADEYEERFGVELDDFFQSTPVDRFRDPTVRKIAAQVHRQRQERLQTSLLEDRTKPPRTHDVLSKTDQAFVEEYSKASTLSAESIDEVVKALRQWERRRDE
jgi:putative hydrolase of HD superfamily